MSIKDKIDNIVNELGGLGICGTEAAALQVAADAWDDAQLERSSAVKNAAGAGTTSVGAGIGGVLCVLATATVIGGVACLAAEGVGILGGTLWLSGSMDGVALADKHLDKATAALDKALDQVCNCMHQHMPQP